MPFLYPFGRYPPNAALVKRVTTAADRLRGLIAETDVSRLDGDEYSKKRFLKGKLRELDHNLTKYAFHVSWIMHLADVPPEQIVLIDHGGGTGLQGLLAKVAGVGTVIYNDINERVLSVARALGEAIELPCNHYVLGDIGPLFDYLDARGIVPSAMVSYDVLEHIYDVDAFFQQLARLCRGPLALFLSSGANMFSPRYVLKLIPVQWRAERRYRAERRAMIAEMAPQLSARELTKLARATQGLCRPDIEKTVAGFLATGSTSEPPRSRTNAFPAS